MVARRAVLTMTLRLSFSSGLLHAVALSPPQPEDEWSPRPLGAQETMAFVYLHVRILTGLSLGVFILKLSPRRREEVGHMLTNPFNSKLLISPLWNTWLPTNNASSNWLSFYPAISKP